MKVVIHKAISVLQFIPGSQISVPAEIQAGTHAVERVMNPNGRHLPEWIVIAGTWIGQASNAWDAWTNSRELQRIGLSDRAIQFID